MDTLSPELLTIIVGLIPKTELYPLLFVNKDIHKFARPLLYKIVDLPNRRRAHQLIKCLNRQPENKKSIRRIRIGPASLPWANALDSIDLYHFLILPALESLLVRYCALHVDFTRREVADNCHLKRLVLDGCHFDAHTLASVLRAACSLQRFLHRGRAKDINGWSLEAARSEVKRHAESLTHISTDSHLLRPLLSPESFPTSLFVGMIDPTKSEEPIQLPGM